jgi:hypothetical protein
MMEKEPRPAASNEAHRAGDFEQVTQVPPGREDGIAWRHLAPPGQTGLDSALIRLLPAAPDHVRRSLRQPLERWRRGAVRYLRSQHSRTDADDFLAVWSGLPGRYSPQRQPHVLALRAVLYREIGLAILRRPGACAWRQSCALLEVIDWLFLGMKGGEVVHSCPIAAPPPGNEKPGDR